MHLVPFIFLLGSLCPLVLCEEGEFYINYNQAEWEKINYFSGAFNLKIKEFDEISSPPGALKDTQYVEIIARPNYNNQKLIITTNEVFVENPRYLTFQCKGTSPSLALHNVLVGDLFISNETTHPGDYLARKYFTFNAEWTEYKVYFPQNIRNFWMKVTLILENSSTTRADVAMLSRIMLHYDEETTIDNQNDTKVWTEDSKTTLLYTRIMEENATTYPPDIVAWFNSSMMENVTSLANFTESYTFNSTEWSTKFPDLWVNSSRIIWPYNYTHDWFVNSTTSSPRTMPDWYNYTDAWYNTSRSVRPYNYTHDWFVNSTTSSPRTMPDWYNYTDAWYKTSRSVRPYNSTYNWFRSSTIPSSRTPYRYNYTTIDWRKKTAPPVNISKFIDGGRMLKLNLTASDITLQNLSLHIEISKRNNEK